MTAPSIGGGHVPTDPGTGYVWGSDGAGKSTPVYGSLAAALRPPSVPRQLTMVSAFQSGHGWTMSGSSASSSLNDTSDYVIGSQSAKFATVTTGPTNANLDSATLTAVDLSGKQVWVLIKVEGITNLTSLRLIVGDSTFTNFRNFNLNASESTANAGRLREGEWTWISFSFANASTTGTGSRTAATKWRLQAASANATSVTVHIGAVAYATNPTTLFPNGVISICFDDFRGTPFVNGRAKLDQYGYRATLFGIVDKIRATDTVLATPGQYLSLAQVKQLHDYSGWEVGCHSYTGVDHDAGFDTLTAAQVTANLHLNRQWIDSNLLGQGETFAWPEGTSTKTVEDAAARVVACGRGNTSSGMETWPPSNPMRIRSALNTTVLATMQAMVDGCKLEQTWLNFTFHEITATGAEQLSVTTAIFNSLIDYINTNGVAVLPVGDVLRAAVI